MTDNTPDTGDETPWDISDRVKYGGPFAVSEKLLEKAQMELMTLEGDFLEDAGEKVSAMAAILPRFGSDTAENENAVGDLFTLVHNLKGKGGTFGYDLFTIIGDLLCRFLEKIDGRWDALTVEVISVHVGSLQAVHAQALKGNGGAEGKALLNGLEQVIAKWEQRD